MIPAGRPYRSHTNGFGSQLYISTSPANGNSHLSGLNHECWKTHAFNPSHSLTTNSLLLALSGGYKISYKDRRRAGIQNTFPGHQRQSITVVTVSERPFESNLRTVLLRHRWWNTETQRHSQCRQFRSCKRTEKQIMVMYSRLLRQSRCYVGSTSAANFRYLLWLRHYLFRNTSKRVALSMFGCCVAS